MLIRSTMAVNITGNPRRKIRIVGLLATGIGVAALLVYPLLSPEMAGRPETPRVSPGKVVLPSLFIGPILVTFGIFSLKSRNLRPLTIKRALFAPVLAAIAGTIGLAHYVYLWNSVTPFEQYDASSQDNYQTIDPSIAELLQREFATSHFLAIAALGGFVAVVTFARRGLRGGLLSALCALLVLIATILAPISTDPSTIHDLQMLLIVGSVVTGFSFVVGYLGSAPITKTRDLSTEN